MIRVPQVRLIGEDGSQIGIVPIDKALDMAFDAGLDLVEVQPMAKPPVCKIMDYGKFKYEKEKKAKVARKKQHVGTVKEMRFSPKITDHDYSYKIKHIREFLLDKDKVKITVKFRGREITYTDQGEQLLERLKKDCEDIARIEQEPKLEGQAMSMMLAPDIKKIEQLKKAMSKK